jgi:hypothetical protein
MALLGHWLGGMFIRTMSAMRQFSETLFVNRAEVAPNSTAAEKESTSLFDTRSVR